jgi:hypothetical protein
MQRRHQRDQDIAKHFASLSGLRLQEPLNATEGAVATGQAL